MKMQEGFMVYELKRVADHLGQLDHNSPIIFKEIMIDSATGKVPLPPFETEEDAVKYLNTQLIARVVTIVKIYSTTY